MVNDLEALWRAARKLGPHHRSRKALPSLLFFTDPSRTPFPEQILGRLPRGAGIVYRAFGAADAAMQARRLAALAKRHGVRFFVGADVSLAIAAGADGIHFPERLAYRPGRNGRLRKRFTLTAAAHSAAAARLARRSGVDAVVVSPVFRSASPSAGRPIGPRRFAALVRAAGAPCYALGGIDAVTIRGLSGTRAFGVAAVGALTGTLTPRPAAPH
jgi:thiamine-phosphate pyrophosphorylase